MKSLIKAICKDKSPPTLTVTTFTPNISKKLWSIVKSKLKVCARYSVRHDDATGTLTEALLNIHPEEDSPLSDIFLKNMYTKIRSLLTVEEKISGYQIFKLIDESASIKKSDADIKILYTQS